MGDDVGRRQTDPSKWGDPWFRGLKKNEKYLMLYLWDKCDWAGFVDNFDEDDVSFWTGMSVEETLGALKGLLRPYKGASKVLGRGKVGAPEGLDLWCCSFIRFQQKKKRLNWKNGFHKKILTSLSGHKGGFAGIEEILDQAVGATEGASKGHQRGMAAPTEGHCNSNVMSCNVKSLIRRCKSEGSDLNADQIQLLVESWVSKDKLSEADFLEGFEGALSFAKKLAEDDDPVGNWFGFMQKVLKRKMEEVDRGRSRPMRTDAEIEAYVQREAG